MAIKKNDSIDTQKNKSVSSDLLESYRGALYQIKQFFDEFRNQKLDIEDIRHVKTMLEIGEKLGKNIETLAVLERKVAQEEQVNSKVRGGAKLSMLEDDTLK